MTDEELEKKHRQNFQRKLNYYMQLNHKRQEDIVVDLGINKSTISTWCRGQKMPRTATIQKLATYFGVTIADFINDDTEKDLNSEILALLEAMPEQKRENAIEYLKFLSNQNDK